MTRTTLPFGRFLAGSVVPPAPPTGGATDAEAQHAFAAPARRAIGTTQRTTAPSRSLS